MTHHSSWQAPIRSCDECGKDFGGHDGGRGLCKICYLRAYRKGTLPDKTLIRSDEERFWEKVDVRGEDECWLWLGAKRGLGYGLCTAHGKGRYAAHRFSWEIHNGSVPSQNVLHRCGNPPCVNPRHLYDGSHAENAQDRIRHGTVANRANGTHRFRKISMEDLMQIAQRVESGEAKRALAREFGVNASSIIRGLRTLRAFAKIQPTSRGVARVRVECIKQCDGMGT